MGKKYPPRLVPKKGHQVLINKLGGRNFLVTPFEPLDLTRFSNKEIDDCLGVQLSLEEGLLLPEYNEKKIPTRPAPPIEIPVLKPAAEDRVIATIKADVTKEVGRGERADIDVSGVEDVMGELEEKRAVARAKHEEETADAEGRARDLTRDQMMDQARETPVELKPEGTAGIPPKTPPAAARKKAETAAKKRAASKRKKRTVSTKTKGSGEGKK